MQKKSFVTTEILSTMDEDEGRALLSWCHPPMEVCEREKRPCVGKEGAGSVSNTE